MIEPHLPPYPAYKPSGLDWLGDVPAHWDLVQLGRIGRFSKGSGGTKADEVPEGVPCIRYGDLYTSHKFHIRASRSCVSETDALNYTPLRYGDILFAGSGETIEEIGKSAVNLIDQPACCGGDVILFRSAREIDATFSGYAIDCPASQYQKSTMGRGITVMHIYGSELKYLWIALPPLPEQTTIANYLDHVDRRIQRYIHAKQKRITLLHEARQSIIHRAVTRGLDPDVPLKPSGVDWLGDIPAHWEVRRLKTLCSMKSGDGISIVSIESVGEYPVYGGNGVRGYTSRFNHDGVLALIGRQGALCGNVHIARGKFWATEHAVVAALHTVHNIVWFGAILTAMNLNQYSLAAAQPGLAVERILNLHLPVPPLPEQTAIAAHLDQATAAIDAAINTARRQSELMRAYRASLIAHVVTGKLDVRAAAAQLPPESAEQEAVGR